MSQSPVPEPSRRRLPKSKTGCRTCKRRKVKCDEGHPACRNCVKHGVECDFIIPIIKTSSSVPSPLTPQPVCNHESNGLFTIDDMELLHHYTTSTHLTITQEPLARNFWRVNIPQMGFSTPYILRGLLSLSALHLARFRPDRKDFYIAQAFLHHNAALPMVAPLITNISLENCVQLFIFSTITNYFAFAKPRDDDDFLLSNNDSRLDWLFLFRGIRALMEAQGEMIHQSEISILFESGIQLHKSWLSYDFDNEAFKELEANIRCSLGGHDTEENMSTLLVVVKDLKRSFAVVYNGNSSDENKTRGIFVWLFKVHNNYINLVAQGNSEALCVLAFFCVLLRRLEFIWWIEGWGLHLVERIYLRLNPTYKLWIRWPIEEIGWVPRG